MLRALGAENAAWFFRGAKTQKGRNPRRSGDSFCGLNVFLQDPGWFVVDGVADAHIHDSRTH
jgi:hypothetical protein